MNYPRPNSTIPHTTSAFTILKNTAALAMSLARLASGCRSSEVWSTAVSSAELSSSTISTSRMLAIIKALPRGFAGSSSAAGIAITAISTSWRNASSCCHAARKPCNAMPVERQACIKPRGCLLGFSTITLLLQEFAGQSVRGFGKGSEQDYSCVVYYSAGSAYDSTGGQAQTRFLSPYTLFTRATLGQNLLSRTQGNGKAAFSRE